MSEKFWYRMLGKLGSYAGFALFIAGILERDVAFIVAGITVAGGGCFVHEVGEE